MKEIINKLITISSYYKLDDIYLKIKDDYININDIACGHTYKDYNGYNEGTFKIGHVSKVIKDNEQLKREIEKLKLKIQDLENDKEEN